jgi:hypothetical protein
MMNRFAAGLVLALSLASAGAQQKGGTLVATLQPFAFLLGTWDAAAGRSGETGGFTFGAAVQGRVITRTNYANYPASADAPASRHDDLMVIYAEGDAVHADYFDSEGHVIRYVAQSPHPGEIVFVSEIKPNEPRYQLRYTANKDGLLSGAFDIAPPGSSGAFKPYLAWTARRRR